MSGRRRNHFIPRFLLNRFASRRDGKKSWIWQISRDGKAVEVSTRDTAVATDFYGGPETGLEDAFAAAETELSQTLARIERGEPLSGYADELRQLVWALAMRTRAFREHFVKVTEGFVEELQKSIETQAAQRAMVRRVEARLFESIEKDIEALPEEARGFVAAFFSDPAAREFMAKEVKGFMRSPLPQLFFGQMRDMLYAQGVLQEAAEEGHIKGLAQMLAEKKPPSAFSPAHWRLCRVETQMVLGDLCIVAVDGEGKYGAILESDVFSWQTLYLPISNSTVLVAGKQELRPLLSPEDVNRISAELSSSHIYCSKPTDSILSLAPLIGAKSPFVSTQEVSDMIADGWENEE
ncbi:MAG TPA: DUF4238 domain-containing protein [Thermoanaerobaculia bacterium]|jgi:hypothetical protein|nr:DUF4238 domain-containing protein [Thermoanaerobaculia bacterium]